MAARSDAPLLECFKLLRARAQAFIQDWQVRGEALKKRRPKNIGSGERFARDKRPSVLLEYFIHLLQGDCAQASDQSGMT